MNRLNLSPADHVSVNVEKILGLVIELEKEKGLDMEEIQYKYTHGFCGALAQLVRIVLSKTTQQTISIQHVDMDCKTDNLWPGAHIEHVYMVTRDPNSTRNKIFPPMDYYYFDILGKHHTDDYSTFTSDPYFVDKDLEQKYPGDKYREKWKNDFYNISDHILDMVQEMSQEEMQ